MKKNHLALIIALTLVCGLLFTTGCVQPPAAADALGGTADALPAGGVLRLSVNPEIAVHYDADGLVTGVEARNDDGAAILAGYAGFEGKAARQVVAELVTAIGEAGYFVEEIEGERRQIVIEIEPGSALPSSTFLADVAADVQACVSANHWQSPVDVRGESDYGLTDYVDTDYGPNNDGVTDYSDTDYGPNSDGVTDYNDTDYGPNSDGVTDYNDTDYGPNNDGVTDYNDTDYGPNSDGVTDYNDTDYGPNSDGATDYNDSAYGGGSGGDSGYDSDSGYGGSDDDGDSGYDRGNDSGYGDSGYDD